uniref:Phosphofructokinase domain-containing protein n=1 Tax=Oryza brachyantha TaxID=4533 RepID=J3MYI4_ORYBR
MDDGEKLMPSLALHKLPTLAGDATGATTSAAIPNPLAHHPLYHPSGSFFVSPTDVVLRDILLDASSASGGPQRQAAQQAIAAGHVEAESAVNGVGLVKLMGRSAGHIALHATLSSRDVDCCLIPEEDFYLRGAGGLFEFLYHRLKKNGHAVVVVAEGAGQGLIPRNTTAPKDNAAVAVAAADESGNPAFLDVGAWLKAELRAWWEEEQGGELFTVKYIDPTYMIRAVPANAGDNLYCTLLAHSAIHGAMAGYTGFVSGPINGNYAYIPMAEVAEAENPVDTMDHKWAWVRSITNQPDFLRAGLTS